ncbi:hypothetical protein [Sphaerotilus mobilis]|uniref:DUF302 domain-containing protein n=1 Tax=Sphaerotilus mobilis TaxID=47994 RepID=A0A4Q7LAY6_9BURK|nr:hypothetical protein [Sphaerotilus mobilis]RZS46800.1 hypothetical protein EV685_3831 [Sphaerotilus mobilis]
MVRHLLSQTADAARESARNGHAAAATAGTAIAWRSWLTGCMAVVMLAAGAVRVETFEQRRRSSHLDAARTVDRLKSAAGAHGLSVIAVIPMPGQHAELVVLGPYPGETAVVQHDHVRDQTHDLSLPLALHVHTTEDGHAEVSFHDLGMAGAQALPGELRDGLAALPALVGTALGEAERPLIGPVAPTGLRHRAGRALGLSGDGRADEHVAIDAWSAHARARARSDA